jgi:DNA primase small subunit
MSDRFPPAVGNTIDWLEHEFCSYYKANPPEMPARHARREFGYILWPDKPGPPPFIRHRAYPDKDKFHWYLGKRGPHSVYYSTAFYRAPAELRMADKEWLGAELIFDLDADHLAEAEAAKAAGREMPLEEQLVIVKKKFIYLLDELLFGDLGIDPKHVFLTFSGGRGYHAHVTDPRLMSLDSKARREIVDYVTAKVPAAKGSKEADLSPFLHKEAVQASNYRGHGKAEYSFRLAAGDEPGWPGRLTRRLREDLQRNVLDAPRSAAEHWLKALPGIGAKGATGFLDKLDRMADNAAKDPRRPELIDLLAEGRISHKSDPLYAIAMHTLSGFSLPEARGETDEPVTADIKRLIRLPGSLHGKTGLRVVTMSRDDLDDFDAFRDATVFDGTVRITPRFDDTLTLAGETVNVTAGEVMEVPKAHAVFWCSRQAGTLHQD